MDIQFDTSGFYKTENDNLLFAPNRVECKEWSIHRASKTEYSYPIHSWYWFDSLELACNFFNIEIPLTDEQI